MWCCYLPLWWLHCGVVSFPRAFSSIDRKHDFTGINLHWWLCTDCTVFSSSMDAPSRCVQFLSCVCMNYHGLASWMFLFCKYSKNSYIPTYLSCHCLVLNGLKIQVAPDCLTTYLQIHGAQKLDLHREKNDYREFSSQLNKKMITDAQCKLI